MEHVKVSRHISNVDNENCQKFGGKGFAITDELKVSSEARKIMSVKVCNFRYYSRFDSKPYL